MAVHDKIIEGKLLYFRPVSLEDAEYILQLRLDPAINQFLNKVDNSLEKQKAWISQQVERDNDYYFVIEDRQNEPVGLISLYGINRGAGEFGRWICTGSALHSLESAILIHKFGFESLGLESIYTNTVVENKKVVTFHKRFGAHMAGKANHDEASGFNLLRGEILAQDFQNVFERNMDKLDQFL